MSINCPSCLFCVREPNRMKCNDPESFSYQKAVDRDWRCKNFTALETVKAKGAA